MPYGNTYRPDRLFLPQEKLLSFASNVPTPFFLYDETGIRKSARTVLGSFCRLPKHRAFFPLWANDAAAVVHILHEEGFGILARSVPELRMAEAWGIPGADILFHTPALTDEAVSHIRRIGCGVIFDAPGQIEKLSDALPSVCLLRYYPEKPYTHAAFTTSSKRIKSGMSREQIMTSAARLAELGRREIGLHCHLSGNSMEEQYYPAAARLLLELAQEIEDKTACRIRIIDIGGGIGIPMRPKEPSVNLPKVGALLREEYGFSACKPTLYTELGRWVVGRHGLLLSRVVELRERGRCYIVLDATAASNPGLLLHRHHQSISRVGSCAKSGRVVYSVQGCTADAIDRFNDCAILPPCAPGDLLALHDVGAYCRYQGGAFFMPEAYQGYLYTTDGSFAPVEHVELQHQQKGSHTDENTDPDDQ